ncbi:MAG: CoA-binding protein, partial [Desulfobacterales bacterium]|nr:CoA-binding protein [Desulfobacterales bacterium]
MNLQPLFAPKTVAVVGVSLSNDRHPANVIYQKNLLRYPVEVFPVNPRGGFLQGEPVYTGIGEIPKPLDLAVIAVRAPQVTDVVAACIRHGVGGAAVISGGFAESGQAERQERLAALARAANFPFVGPNCLGIYVPNQVDTFFLPTERMVRPEAGNVALVSQSGGILVDQMVKFADEG